MHFLKLRFSHRLTRLAAASGFSLTMVGDLVEHLLGLDGVVVELHAVEERVALGDLAGEASRPSSTGVGRTRVDAPGLRRDARPGRACPS